MTKTTLIENVSAVTKGAKKETEQVIDAVLASITDALVKGEEGYLFRIWQLHSERQKGTPGP